MLLDIQQLTIFAGDERRPIVSGADLAVSRGEIAAVVGGSGSGKTTLGLSVLRLIDPALRVSSGKIIWKGQDVLRLSEKKMRMVRGPEISMVFQEPLNAFDPLFSIQEQMDEILRAHTPLKQGERKDKMVSLLKACGISDAGRILQSYPHQLSGGLRQRAMIAQALACDPSLIIADEPTSSIDVTLQAKIIELFQRLREDFKLSLVFITHDFGIVRHLADTVYVMNNGRIIESGPADDVLDHPGQAYTKQLIQAAA